LGKVQPRLDVSTRHKDHDRLEGIDFTHSLGPQPGRDLADALVLVDTVAVHSDDERGRIRSPTTQLYLGRDLPKHILFGVPAPARDRAFAHPTARDPEVIHDRSIQRANVSGVLA
jgi:hypothetical protein